MSLVMGVSGVYVSPDTNTAAWTGNPPTLNESKTWHNLGKTQGGVRFRLGVDTTAVECDQSQYPVLEMPTRGTLEIEAPLLEQNAANLKLAFTGVYDSSASLPLVVEQINRIPDPVDLKLESAVLDGKKKILVFTKVRPRVNVDTSFARDAATVMTIVFQGTSETEIAVFEVTV